MRATVPEEWRGERVDLLFVSRSEAALWRDGAIVQGLNTGGGGERPDAVLAAAAEPGAIELQIELACNGMFGAADAPAELLRCDIARFDPEAWRLCLRLRDAARARGRDARRGLVGPRCARSSTASATRAIRRSSTALYEHRNATHAHELAAIGHAHIDTAWLWPLAETYRKTLRTFSSQLRYMEDYPEYRFACSQAQQYAWIKERNPDLWRRLRAAVERGQFVPVGGSWVEPDCNLPSGESLVRQFLHGQRWFEREFGRRHREFWSPDAFGYAGQLPQILRGAGHHALPHAEALVEPLQQAGAPHARVAGRRRQRGARALPAGRHLQQRRHGVRSCSRPCATTRITTTRARACSCSASATAAAGPTRDMLETLRRARDLQGLPRTAQRTSEEFFAALEAEGGDRPVVSGELYFEYHRGVYTSQARTKRGNRRCEQALHDAEFLACLGGDYPRAELDRLWKLLLLQQFHDILPGSSIGLVHAESERDLAAVEAGAHALAGAGETLVNTLGFARREVVGDALVAAAPFGAAHAASRPDDEVRVDGLALENAHLRVTLAPGRLARVACCTRRAAARRSPRPATGSSSARTGPVNFEAWDIDPSALETRRDFAPGDVVARERDAAPRRDRLRAAVAHAGRPARRGLAPGRVPHDDRLAGGAHAADGVLPARGARAHRHLRDAVRLTRSARRTARRAGTGPATRCRATAGPISPSTASASRC